MTLRSSASRNACTLLSERPAAGRRRELGALRFAERARRAVDLRVDAPLERLVEPARLVAVFAFAFVFDFAFAVDRLAVDDARFAAGREAAFVWTLSLRTW